MVLENIITFIKHNLQSILLIEYKTKSVFKAIMYQLILFSAKN